MMFTKAHRGGIRGVVKLEVLAVIERELGGQIPIVKILDLIVARSE
jgi:hypothetical protein